MNCDVLREVFNIEADIVIDPRSGVPCLPYALAGERQQAAVPEQTVASEQMVMNGAMMNAAGRSEQRVRTATGS